MTMLRLELFEDGFDEYIHVDWPTNVPRLQALLIAEPVMYSPLNGEFVIANMPPGHSIYYVVGTPLLTEHERMKQKLKARGESFTEIVETTGEETVGFIRHHKVPSQRGWILGSTASKETILAIFENYISWLAFSWSFLFIVGEKEPPYWQSRLELLDFFKLGGSVPHDLIQETHCIMRTEDEDAMSIASTKVSREQIVNVAREIAKAHSTELSVETHKPP